MKYYSIITLVLLSQFYLSYSTNTDNANVDNDDITTASSNIKSNIEITACNESRIFNKTINEFIDFNKQFIDFNKQFLNEIKKFKLEIDLSSISNSINTLKHDIASNLKYDSNTINKIVVNITDAIKQFEPFYIDESFFSKFNTVLDKFNLETFVKDNIEYIHIIKTFIITMIIVSLIHAISMLFFVVLVVYYVFIKSAKKKNKLSMNVGYSTNIRN